MSERVPILYVGGYGRSGSTILAQTLGRIPGFVNVGELWQVWYRGLRDNELCGCGQPFYSCEFWGTVGDEAFGGWDNVDGDKMWAFRPALEGWRYVPRYALAAKIGIRNRDMNELLKEGGPLLERLYRAIQRVSGDRVIVDSSKRLPYAFVLRLLSFADLRVVHLVRDSRAVAYSWTKSKVRPEVVGRRVLMPQLSPVQASRVWSRTNFLYSFFPPSTSLSRLRYEDFISNPAFYLGRTLTGLGFDEEANDLYIGAGQEISPAVDHTISGNPGRFRTGTIRLRTDEEWKFRMKSGDRAVVTTLTAPLLLKYGYLRGGVKSR